jgi:hypothetical protein
MFVNCSLGIKPNCRQQGRQTFDYFKNPFMSGALAAAPGKEFGAQGLQTESQQTRELISSRRLK